MTMIVGKRLAVESNGGKGTCARLAMDGQRHKGHKEEGEDLQGRIKMLV